MLLIVFHAVKEAIVKVMALLYQRDPANKVITVLQDREFSIHQNISVQLATAVLETPANR